MRASLRFLLLHALMSAVVLTVVSGVSMGAEDARVVVRAGTLYTLDEAHVSPLRDAWILIGDGKILEVSTSPDLPDGVTVVDYSRETVLPGLVALGIAPTGGPTPGKSVAPEFLAVDSYDFFDKNEELLAGGVTTLGVTTGSRRLLSGRGLVVKTANAKNEASDRVVRRRADFHVTLGDPSKNPPSVYEPPILPSPDNPFEVLKRQAPVSRGGALRALRQVLDKGRAFREQLEKARRGEGPVPDADAELEPLLEILDGRNALVVHANRVHDILAMLDFARQQKLKILFDGGRESHRIIAQLREHTVPLIVPGEFVPGSIPSGDLSRPTLNGQSRDGLASALIQSGLSVAIRSPSTGTAPFLLLQAVESMRYGLDARQALRAVTRTPAELLRVGHRVGSIAVGKDADLFVVSDDPFEGASRTVAVYIDGQICYPLPKSAPTSNGDEKLPGATVAKDAAGARAKDGPTVAIRCGTVHTSSGQGVLRGGVVIIKDGKIVKVGTAALLATLSPGTRIIDASQETVVPGLIDAGSHLGLHRDTLLPEDEFRQAVAEAGGGRATYRIADAVDFSDGQMDGVRRAGITTVLLSPDPDGAFSGQLTAVKLSSQPLKDAVLRDPAALLLGSISASAFKKAKSYHDKWIEFEKAEEDKRKKEKEKAIESLRLAESDAAPGVASTDGEDEKDSKKDAEKPADAAKKKEIEKPEPNEEYDIVRKLFQKKLPVVVRVSNELGLASVYANLVDKYGLEIIVYGLDELSPEAVRELRRREIKMLLGPDLVRDKSARELIHLPRQLDAAGIPFAFRSGSGSGSRQLPLQVAYAVRRGWSEEAALEAMTIGAARIFGIDTRVGSLEARKDADLVFMNGSPFKMTSRVTRVMVNGKIVYQEGGDRS